MKTDLVAQAQALSAEQITAIQHAMKLSDAQLLEAIGYDVNSTSLRHLRRWKTGEDTPKGTARTALKLLFAMDRANRLIDSGEWDRGHEVLRNALPDFMQ